MGFEPGKDNGYGNQAKIFTLYSPQVDQDETSLLPSKYHRIDWLRSYNGAYIDTGVQPTDNTSVEIKFQCHNTSGNGSGFFGARNSTKRYTFICGSDDKYALAYGADNQSLSGSQWNWDNNIHTLYRNKNVVTLDDTYAYENTPNEFDIQLNCALFAYNDSGTVTASGSYTMWYCKIWENETLVRNFVPYVWITTVQGLPVYRPVMYDSVTDQFFANSGSGYFSIPS